MTEIPMIMLPGQPDPTLILSPRLALPVADAPAIKMGEGFEFSLPEDPALPSGPGTISLPQTEDPLIRLLAGWSGISADYAPPRTSGDSVPEAPLLAEALPLDPTPQVADAENAVPLQDDVPTDEQAESPPAPDEPSAPGPDPVVALPTQEAMPKPPAIMKAEASRPSNTARTEPAVALAQPSVEQAPADRMSPPVGTATHIAPEPLGDTRQTPAPLAAETERPINPEPLEQLEARPALAARADAPQPEAPRTETVQQPRSAPQHDPRPVARQIADAVVTTREGETEIALAPEELGRLRLVMTGADRGHVTIFAERPETLDLIRRNADLLTQTLADAGIEQGSLDFREERRDSAPAPHDDAPEGSPAATVEHVATRPRPLSDRRLDIRI
ncbi:flagellar hook-length control protein FliK [Paracoccus zeaxanthinifaciens]|uniref:flagellar hook-length control protein FliK n=1 Tax=Paracoccus zeaxanthinifaciens TaxID=187400 RepID=UPI000418B809|nr:flagellar hook-length control protein FliK [Paracoccus zeaxanthinifaciens]